MVSTSGRVPERAPDWFFVAIEACSGETSDLGFFSEVSIFIRIFGVGNKSGGARGAHKQGAPPRLVASSVMSWPNSRASGLFWSIKNHRKFLAHSENFYFYTKNDTMVVLLKTASVWVSSDKSIPKPYKIVVNMA